DEALESQDEPALSADGEEDLRDSLERPLGPISRAIVAANRPRDERFNLLARVEVQPDALLEIYEPRPGPIGVSVAGAPAGAPRVSLPELQGVPVRELWAEFTDDAPMPAALAASIARTGDVAVEFAAPAAPTGPRELAAATRPSASGWCDTS